MKNTPVLGFAAWSGTGKTTLLEKLIPLLRDRGLRIAIIKHAHHDFDIDVPGKDSHRLRKAGAQQVMVASRRRWALITEQDDEHPEPRLAELLVHLDHQRLDLVLAEGFKHESIPKIEIHRPSQGKPLLHADDPDIIAVVSDGPLTPTRPLPLLDLNTPEVVAAFVADYVRAQSGR